VSRIRPRFTSDHAVEHRTDLILGTITDLVAGPAKVEDLLAGGDILSQGGRRQCGCEGWARDQRRPYRNFVYHVPCPLISRVPAPALAETGRRFSLTSYLSSRELAKGVSEVSPYPVALHGVTTTCPFMNE